MIDMKWENGLLGFVSMFVLPPQLAIRVCLFSCVLLT